MSVSNVTETAARVKQDSFQMASLTIEMRNQALTAIAQALQKHSQEIFKENQKDLEAAVQTGIPGPILKRLKFDEGKLQEVIEGIGSVISLPDPLNRKLLARELDKDLTLYRITCPIGVIGVIFESRPDALVQIAALCLKSGNCAVLKGGSEALHTNRILYQIISKAAAGAGIPDGYLTLLETRAEISDLLSCHESIDLLIPRGSNEFVQSIMANSRIPVMGHADGVCHIYVDEAADQTLALSIIADAKTQYVAACNTVETILVHRSIAKAFLPKLKQALEEKQVSIRGTGEVQQIIDSELLPQEDFHKEYLDYILGIHLVDDLDQAITHINRYGSHHTDCILTQDPAKVERFMTLVDSAGVYHNCSTRFADGFRYGFGAEVGISTGKLHARGPVGMEGLVTYKYRLYGRGQIVGDYASGKSSFHFKDL